MASHSKLNVYSGTDNLEVMQEAENYNQSLLDLVLRFGPSFNKGESPKILDFGAGIGSYAVALREMGYDVYCVEPDQAQAEQLRQQGLPVFQSLGEADDDFDFIYTLNVLEHIEQDLAVMKQLYARLKPSGSMFIYVPAFAVLFTAMDEKVGHYRRYRRSQLHQLAELSGFDVKCTRYADSLGFLATVLYKWIGNKQGTINRRALKTYDRWIFPLSRQLDKVVGRWIGKNVYAVLSKSHIDD